ncbi:uncharacterized protein LOC133173080 isoform X1 [Saccostrea echinata]|uniref:uncharacterized protein LOC133173080 isoform X1 n=1 Tax=Saccostrea echinata TaxID=191078 RepID=UPI002A840F32|nr:uncharacterized protein LOC133173080 isoform X1 [Saccostrea echinata]XP_061163982.1 uncharacterized protein LOC133173080 isoform X1 [Saccostrea echinata]
MEEDSWNPSPSSSISQSPLNFLSPSEPRRKKRKLTSSSRLQSRSFESDDSYNSEVKYGRCCGNHVSKWDICVLESVGILYDEKATELSELYKSSLEDLYPIVFEGIKDHAVFWTKLLEIKECLIESTEKCMQSLDAGHMSQLESSVYRKEFDKSFQAVTKIKEEMLMKIGSPSSLDYLSRYIFSIWGTGISEYVHYYSGLIKELNTERRSGVNGEFSQLLIFFSKIFLLNPLRGDAKRKMQMRLNGVDTTSVPDVRYSLLGDCTPYQRNSSVLTVTSGEMKMWKFKDLESAPDFNIRDLKFQGQSLDRLLGQHGGELLVENLNSVLFNTVLGIICIQTTVIFTCLKLDPEHLRELEDASKPENGRSRIHYSKPYNFLVKKDREEILDTMFHLGLLCRVRSLHFYQD